MTEQRQLPANIEAEQSVLGAMFLSRRAIAVAKDKLDVEDFYLEKHQKIFKVICDLNSFDIPIDNTTVKSELEKRNLFVEVGGVDYMAVLTNVVPTAANIEYYVNLVDEKAVLRRLIHTATEIIKNSYSDEALTELIDNAERSILEVAKRRKAGDIRPISKVLTSTYANIEKSAAIDSDLAGVSTGFDDLDAKLSGFKPNELIILAARPALGKTAFALNLAMNVALNTKKPVVIFNLEMGAEQLAMRLLAATAKIDLSKIINGALTAKDWDMLSSAISKLSDTKIFIDDAAGITVNEIRAKCRRLKNTEDELALVVIDYLQLITTTNRNGGNRQQEVSEISRMLKVMAKELEIPVLALSQLSRGVESREDKRPVMSDLRESGAIEQDADVVSFLYRDDYYNRPTDEDNPTNNLENQNNNESLRPDNSASIVEVIIGKHRSGPTGTVKVVFLKNYQLFRNYVERD